MCCIRTWPVLLHERHARKRLSWCLVNWHCDFPQRTGISVLLPQLVTMNVLNVITAWHDYSQLFPNMSSWKELICWYSPLMSIYTSYLILTSTSWSIPVTRPRLDPSITLTYRYWYGHEQSMGFLLFWSDSFHKSAIFYGREIICVGGQTVYGVNNFVNSCSIVGMFFQDWHFAVNMTTVGHNDFTFFKIPFILTLPLCHDVNSMHVHVKWTPGSRDCQHFSSFSEKQDSFWEVFILPQCSQAILSKSHKLDLHYFAAQGRRVSGHTRCT